MPPRPHRPTTGTPRPRPRKSKPAENGTHAPDPTERLEAALLELLEAKRAFEEPRGALDGEVRPREDLSPETQAIYERALRRLADIETIGTGPQPRPMAQQTEPPDVDAWLVEGFIRPGTTVMITGLPGAAKSWLVRQLAIAAGAGRSMFLDHYPITRPMRVLVLDEDNGEREEWRREERLLAYLEAKRSDVANVWRLSLAGVELDKEHWQRWLRGLILGLELDLVILDPISEMHGGKELRDDDGFRSLLRFLKQLKVDFPQLATILVHHNRKRSGQEKGAESSIEDVRGQWGQTPDVVAIMRSLADRRIRWDLMKRVPHSSLILQQADGGGLEYVADPTANVTAAQRSDGKVLAAIDAGARTAEEIQLGTGLSKSGTHKVLTRLHGAGLITKRAPYERVRDSDDAWFGGGDEPIE